MVSHQNVLKLFLDRPKGFCQYNDQIWKQQGRETNLRALSVFRYMAMILYLELLDHTK
jgi:hypothetical protein